MLGRTERCRESGSDGGIGPRGVSIAFSLGEELIWRLVMVLAGEGAGA